MTDDLSPIMKKRLEEWRKNILQIKSAEKATRTFLSSCRPVRRDYGDDIRDFEKKIDK